MRSYIVLGAAALVAASPAPIPQAFDTNKVAAIPVTITRGAPVGVGPATVTGVYNQDVALATAAAAVAGATTAAAVSKRSLEERSFCIFGICFGKQQTTSKATSTTPVKTPAQTPAPTTSAPAISSVPTNVVPSTCTPISWTNTFAFTSDTACPSPYEVGTYCGFINPEDPCAPQPAAYGPPTTPDTVDAFQKNTVYHQLALNAKTPSGYAQTFQDLNASVNANSYLGYKVLQSYDVAGCSAYCDATDLCNGFNIFIERDPAWNPEQCSCTNPTSNANYKCSIWGSGVTKEAAVNYGQTRDGFQVVIVGSNGYERSNATVPTPPGSNNPQNCGGKLHNQPQYCLGQQSFPGPFDASLCAAYANKQNSVNQQAGLISTLLSLLGFSPAKCVQYQAAEIEQNGAAWGTHCRLFTKKFDKSQATLNLGGQWGCGKSYTFDLA